MAVIYVPRTVKGYLKFLKKVSNISIFGLKGYDELSEPMKVLYGESTAGISNDIGEIEYCENMSEAEFENYRNP